MIILLLSFLTIFILYKYFFQPWRLYNWYEKHLTQLGYKVYKFKWHPIGGRVTQKFKDDYKQYGDANYFMKHCQEYDVVMTVLGGRPLLFIVNPQLMKEYFAADKVSIYRKEQTFNGPFIKAVGKGIVFSEDADWKRKRKALTTVFSHEFLISLIPQICSQVDINFDQVEKSQLFPKVYISDLMTNIFGGIIAKSFFGSKILQQKIDGKDIRYFANNLINQVIIAARSPGVFMFGVQFFNLGLKQSHRILNKKIKTFKQKSKQFIFNRIKQVETQQNSFKTDIISQLHQLNKKLQSEEDKYTPQQMVDQFTNLFFAGLTTTTQFTTMMVYYLAVYPQIKHKLMDEINSVIKGQQDYTYENLKKLKYLECVQKQTLRYYGPGSTTITREAVSDHMLKNVKIWKGTTLSNLVFPNGFNQKYFKDPFKYNPDRWLVESQNQIPPFATPNFAGGPRNCLGKNLALLENKICIIRFLKRYNYTLQRNQFRMEMRSNYVPQRIYTTLQKIKQ